MAGSTTPTGTRSPFNKKAYRVVYLITFLRLPVTSMKKSLKSAFFGLASGTATFFVGSWAIFSVLLGLEGWNTGPTDPDYVQADAFGIWTVFVRAVLGGGVIGLLTFAAVARYTFRRTQS